MHIEAQYSADLDDSVEPDVLQIRIGDGVFGGEQCLGDVHLDVFERFHTCAQQIEDAQSGAQLIALMKKCTLQATVSHQEATALLCMHHQFLADFRSCVGSTLS